MGTFRTGFGIDLRPNHLALTLLRKSPGRIRVVDFALHPIPPEEQKEERETQAVGLINGFILKHRIKRGLASIAIPREKAVVRFIRLPIATRENLRKVLEYETPRYTPFEKEEVYLDYHLLKEEKEWFSLIAVFAKRSDIDSYLSLLKKVGIKPVSIQIPSIAGLNLFAYNLQTEESKVSVLLDVNEPYFEMNLLEGGDWKESLHLPMPSEEKGLKMVETYQRLGWETSSSSKPTFFVFGLNADEALLTTLKKTDGINGVFPPPMGRMKITGDLAMVSRAYASLGVPLMGVIKPDIPLTLLPTEMKKKERPIGKFLLIFLISLAVLIGLIQAGKGFYQYRDELRNLNEEIKKRKPEVETVEKLQKQQEAIGKEISELEKIRSEEISKIEMLKELTRLLPPSAWVWNLKYNGKEIEISGFADSASDLIPLLDKSPFFDKVEFMAPVTKERQMKPEGTQEKERFKIKARIEARRTGS
ncbi:MAG: PilN domain-containing protein [Thermodesulfobacteriota bacterium]